MSANKVFFERFTLPVTALGGLSYISAQQYNSVDLQSIELSSEQLKLNANKADFQHADIITRIDRMVKKSEDWSAQVVAKLDLMKYEAKADHSILGKLI
ncbi:hypothetical protein MIR68_011964 [Amoeboaphelidium protococcarum]|nr:hypothetical protein MIR68_011964 [Amoeboaphelidium protococcarum]